MRICFLLIYLFIFSSCVDKKIQNVEKITKTKKLSVRNHLIGCTLVNDPLEMKDQTGILIEFTREVFKKVGKEIEIVVWPWKRCQEETKTGKVDFLFNVGKSAERAKYAYFTKQILFLEDYWIFKNKDNSKVFDKSFKNLKSFSLVMQSGYKYGGKIQKAINEKRFEEIIEVKDIKQMIKMVNLGRGDVFVGDKIPSKYFLKKLGLSERVIPITKASTWPTYYGFSKKTIKVEFVSKVSAAIAELQKNGTYKKIVAKYLNKN